MGECEQEQLGLIAVSRSELLSDRRLAISSINDGKRRLLTNPNLLSLSSQSISILVRELETGSGSGLVGVMRDSFSLLV